MIEFWNVVIAAIAGGILGAAIHSAWLHSKERKEFGESAGARSKRKHSQPEAPGDAP